MISTGKRRYSVSLTPGVVDRFQSLCRRFNLPPSTMSLAIDAILGDASDVLETALNRGTLKFSDLMKILGEQLSRQEEQEAERRKSNASKQKRNTVCNRKAA